MVIEKIFFLGKRKKKKASFLTVFEFLQQPQKTERDESYQKSLILGYRRTMQRAKMVKMQDQTVEKKKKELGSKPEFQSIDEWKLYCREEAIFDC